MGSDVVQAIVTEYNGKEYHVQSSDYNTDDARTQTPVWSNTVKVSAYINSDGDVKVTGTALKPTYKVFNSSRYLEATVAFILVTFNGTYTNGWKNLSFLPPFIKMVNGENNNLLGSHVVSTTNNQGGYTDCKLTLEVQYTNNTVSLLYTTEFMHSYYTTSFNLNGTCTIMCFN